jgi:hypothetical protein
VDLDPGYKQTIDKPAEPLNCKVELRAHIYFKRIYIDFPYRKGAEEIVDNLCCKEQSFLPECQITSSFYLALYGPFYSPHVAFRLFYHSVRILRVRYDVSRVKGERKEFPGHSHIGGVSSPSNAFFSILY